VDDEMDFVAYIVITLERSVAAAVLWSRIILHHQALVGV
jgi:hypothetical protein